MKRVTILYNFENFTAGMGVAVEDGVAAMWQQQGKCAIGPDNLPLKKGNLEFYNNCSPMNPAEIAAATSKQAKAPTVKEPPVVEVQSEEVA